jgi:hypothetical protein
MKEKHNIFHKVNKKRPLQRFIQIIACVLTSEENDKIYAYNPNMDGKRTQRIIYVPNNECIMLFC